ncbi:hypothetical protein [Clostridium sporogenes]|uniref:hypothetical protein n=1 Tax=Clostridium sporogenes TaxID=1509 RepID=UPI003DA5A699
MSYSTNNQKLNKYLDELAAEYRELLLKKLLENTRDMEDISISELIRIDTKIKESLMENKAKEVRKQKLLLSTGLLYITLGIFIYMFLKLKQNEFMDIPYLLSVLISYMGMLIMIMAFLIPYFNNKSHNKSMNKINNKSDDKIVEYEVIMTWRELEGIANDLSNNHDMKPILPGKIIQLMFDEKLITKEESETLKELLNLRNNIAHSSQYCFSRQELIIILNKTKNIIEKLKKIL